VHYYSMIKPKVIIHGGLGASPTLGCAQNTTIIRQTLTEIIRNIYEHLQQGTTALDAVVYGCTLLEDNPLFNAGTGSVIQQDGIIRMSAGLMDSHKKYFSGVINVSNVKNPILLASHLQDKDDRVLSETGANALAQQLGMADYNPVTPERMREYMENIPSTEDNHGTIGVVCLDCQGKLAAGTSTGGKGMDTPGRVSDAPTTAGTYCNDYAAISCTGIGEHIMSSSFATRVAVRVADDVALAWAMHRAALEAQDNNRLLAAIALTSHGEICWAKSQPGYPPLAMWHNGYEINDCIEDYDEPLFGMMQ
jgi:L-asparaginase